MPNRRTGRSGSPAVSADTAGTPAGDSGEALPDAGNTGSPHRLTIPEVGDLTVALTGWGQDEDRRRSQEAGFDAHLVKPVDHTELGRLLVELGAGDLNRGP